MRLNSIQFLRASAVILVVHTHGLDIQMIYSVSWQQHFFYLDNFGAIGADMFFVISGFIISYVANKYVGINEGLIFLKKRFLRVNPVYYFVSLIAFIVFFICFNPFPWEKMFRELVDTIFMIPVLNIQTSLYPIISVGWTLSFEWWFYILFFLLVIVNVKNKVLPMILLILFAVMMGYIFRVKDFRLIFITNPIMLEFCLGVVIYWLYCHVKIPVYVGYITLLLGIAGYVYNIIFGYGNISELSNVIFGMDSIKRVLLWGGPSACIVAGCIFLENNGVLRFLWNNRLMLLLGAASYSIYLTHFPFFYLLMLLYARSGFFLNPDLAVLVHMLIALSVGILFYKVIEKPLLEHLYSKT
jgi:peptidoglycan/LPS O-acetylase OafA/YrhL